MVQIKVKGLMDGVHIYAEYDKEAEFLVEIEKRLKLFHAHGKTIEAFFSFTVFILYRIKAIVSFM